MTPDELHSRIGIAETAGATLSEAALDVSAVHGRVDVDGA
jgi:hypothetical protein